MGDTITTLLVRRGILPVEKLDRILQHQVIFGGTVDTAVLELGYAKEIPLMELLVEATGFPTINLKRFRPPSNVDQLRKLISFKMAKRHGVLPVIMRGTDRVGVLVLSTMDQAKLKELAFLLGVKLEPRVVLEVRFWQISEQIYGVPPEPRFERLIQKLGPIPFYPPRIIQPWFQMPAAEAQIEMMAGDEDTEQMDESEIPAPPFDSYTSGSQEPVEPPFKSYSTGEHEAIDEPPFTSYSTGKHEAIDEPPFDEPFQSESEPEQAEEPFEEEAPSQTSPQPEPGPVQEPEQDTEVVEPEQAMARPVPAEPAAEVAEEPSTAGEPAKEPETLSVAKAASIFNTSSSRDEIVDTLLSFAGSRMRGALFAIISHETISVHRSTLPELEGREMPYVAEGACLELLAQGKPWQGDPRACPVSSLVSEALDASWAMLVPIKVAKKVIGFLWTWGERPELSVEGELHVACEMASNALLRILIERKKSAVPTTTDDDATVPVGASSSMPDPDALLDRVIAGDEHATAALKNLGLKALSRLKARFPGPVQDPAHQPHLKPSEAGPLLRLLVEWGVAGAAAALELLRDDDEEKRYYAAFLFQEIRSPEVVPILGELLYEDTDRVAHMALETIRSYKNDSAVNLVLEDARRRLLSHDEKERRRAIMVATFLGDIKAVPNLTIMLRDPATQKEARRALISIALKDLGDDPDAWKRWAMEHEDMPRVRFLIGELASPEEDTRRWAIEELRDWTGQDFGYSPDAPQEERHEAIKKWMEWWYMEGIDQYGSS